MRRNEILIALTAIGSALCWLPVFMQPTLDLPPWFPLIVVVLLVGLSTSLSDGKWLRYFVVSSFGALVGLCFSVATWPEHDQIARSYWWLALVVSVTLSVLAAFVAGLITRKLLVSNKTIRQSFWIALWCCVAYAPIVILLTPALVAGKISRNDRIASMRFESLKEAAERAKVQNGGLEHICDGAALEQNYYGPAFSESDWKYIVGNYVKQDGYVFGIWCHQSITGGYTIEAHPDRPREDGSRRFCTDESGIVGCGMKWNRVRNACIPCTLQDNPQSH